MIESVELVIKQPGQADRIVRLHEGATRIGRAEDNEVVLSDVGVSRRHAQVYVSRGEVTVEDLGSGNGTYYNGYRVQSQPVSDNDEIVIDPFVLQFRIRGQERARPGGDGAGANAGARLEVVVGTGMAGSSYPVTSRGLSIGRSEDRDVVIPDPAASRHHCQLSQQGNDYMLRDMGSANGIFVNGVRVRECTLADNDVIRIGNTEMRFIRSDQSTMAASPPPMPSMSAAPSSRLPRDWADAPVGLSNVRPTAVGSRRPAESGGGVNFGRVAALLFAGSTVFLMFMTVVLVGSFMVYAYMNPSTEADFEATPPRWRLDLPPNLQKVSIPALFKEGREKMKERDHKQALQAFWRVLNVDPGRPGVGKFAYAAGEALVLETLREDFTRREELKARSVELRKKYLGWTKSKSAATRRKGEFRLKQKFNDDPVVIEAMGWQPPEEMVKRQQKARDANEKIKLGSLDEAALMLEDLLREAKTPELRQQVIDSWLEAQQALAAQTQEQWAEAVLLEARGEKGAAKREFKTLAREHAQLPSARAHLERY
ncbi:MAG: FHA domain-containing protein [Myxococcota bacterium]